MIRLTEPMELELAYWQIDPKHALPAWHSGRRTRASGTARTPVRTASFTFVPRRTPGHFIISLLRTRIRWLAGRSASLRARARENNNDPRPPSVEIALAQLLLAIVILVNACDFE